MMKSLVLLLVVVSLSAAGCNGGAPLADTPSTPRPAPGTPTKDVMIPSAKTGQ